MRYTVVLFAAVCTALAAWQIETIADTDGVYTSMALDASGNPHVCFGMFDLWYASCEDDLWTIECIDSVTANMNVSLALTAYGHPRISCRHGDPGSHVLMTAKWTGYSWETDIIDSMGFENTSIAVGSDHQSRIAFHGSSSLNYATWTGATWQVEVVESDCGGTAASLVLDDSDNPFIAYSHWDDKLNLATFNGSTWDIETVDSGASMEAEKISLCLDDSQNPRIAYRKGFDLYYAFHDGSQWHYELVDDSCVTPLASISMDLTQSGEPRIAYTHITPVTSTIWYARRDSGVWSTEYVTDGHAPSVALSDQDLARISIGLGMDGVNFAWEYEEGIETEQGNAHAPWVISPNPTAGSFSIGFNLSSPEMVEVAVLDLAGRTVMPTEEHFLQAGAGSINLTPEDLSSGLYICSVTMNGITRSKLLSIVR